MYGMADLAEDVFQSPVRVGTPIELGGIVDVINNPMYATCTGLIQYGSKRIKFGLLRELQGRNLFDKIFFTYERLGRRIFLKHGGQHEFNRV